MIDKAINKKVKLAAKFKKEEVRLPYCANNTITYLEIQENQLEHSTVKRIQCIGRVSNLCSEIDRFYIIIISGNTGQEEPS